MESIVTEATTVLAAFAATAEGLLVLAQGMDATATQALRRAIQLSAEVDLWDIVADLVDRLPEVARFRDDGERLHELAAGMRRGTVSMHDAIASI